MSVIVMWTNKDIFANESLVPNPDGNFQVVISPKQKQQILENQKLRELIEKRIEYFEFLSKQPTSKIALTEIDYESIELRKKELQKILDKSEK